MSSIMLLCCPLVAFAGEPADSSVVALGEVNVTAIKSAGSGRALRSVAATVVNEAEVERLGIVTMKNVSEIAPNFYIPDYGTRMTSSIYVRGLGARIDQPVVGLNVDNVPILNKDNYDFDLVDIARIEVLRGPQSTLYGRNTMAGVVNITTLSPLSYEGWRATLLGGTGPEFRLSLGGYFRLSSKLGMSLTLQGNYLGGYFTNEYNGAKADREEGGSARWKTAWRPRPGLTIENTASFSLSRQHGYPYASVETGRIAYNDTCFYRRTAITDGLTITRHHRYFTVSTITGFQYINDNMTLDQDFLPVNYFNLTQSRREWALTQDVIVRGTKGRYSWLGGLFGFYRHTSMDAPVTFKEDGIANLIVDHRNDVNPFFPIVWNDTRLLLDSHFTSPVYGIAVYHRSQLDLGNRWTIAADLRLDHEAPSLDYRSICHSGYTIMDATGTVPVVHAPVSLDIDNDGHLSKNFTQLLPKLTVTFKLPLPSSTIYASVAKGYKAGGYNTQMFSDVLQQQLMETMGLTAKYDVDKIIGYEPEKSWNYEIGAHLCSRDRRLEGSVAAFYIDCRDQQLTMFPDGTTTGRIMTNAGKSRSAGVEISGRFAPSARWIFNAAYGFCHAEFVEFVNGLQDFSGKRVPYAPSNTLFLNIVYRNTVASRYELTAEINCRGVGNIYWDEINSYSQPFYMQLGASVAIARGCWSLTLRGENLTDCRFDTFSYVSIGNRFMQRGKPVRGDLTLRIDLPRL